MLKGWGRIYNLVGISITRVIMCSFRRSFSLYSTWQVCWRQMIQSMVCACGNLVGTHKLLIEKIHFVHLIAVLTIILKLRNLRDSMEERDRP